MGIGTIVASVVAIAKAIPAARDIIVLIHAKIQEWESTKLQNEYNAKEEKLDALIGAISSADTREKRRVLSKILFDYSIGDYSNKLPK